MGVPVVTLAGRLATARGGVSILSNLGHPEWIAQTPDQYLQIVTELSQDLPKLAALRAGLRTRMLQSPLMDATTFTRQFESACRVIWERWCS